MIKPVRKISKLVACTKCEGEGKIIIKDNYSRCCQCNGNGWIVKSSSIVKKFPSKPIEAFYFICPDCGGTGFNYSECDLCKGNGLVPILEDIKEP